MNMNMNTSATTQKGEIGTTLTVLGVVLMTIGVFTGSALVNRAQNTTATQAQASAQIIANTSNPDIQTSFGAITNRTGTRQKRMDATICFKDGSGFPPTSGRYKIEAFVVLKDATSVNIGGALEQTLENPATQFKCPNQKTHTVFTYSSLADVPGNVTYSDIDHIEFHLNPKAGTWPEPAPTSLIGRLNDITPIFGAPPATPTPSTPPAAPTPVVCPQLTGIVPQATLDAAVANPAGVAGWNALEKPAEPESATNRRKRSLTLKNITIPFHPLSNSLIFEAVCKTLPAAPGKLTVNVKLTNQTFTGVFNGFEYVVQTCDFNDKNRNGTYDYGDYENCGTGSNKKSPVRKIEKSQVQTAENPFNKTNTEEFDMPGGKRVLLVHYGFWKNYGTSTALKDNSGIEIDFSDICTSTSGNLNTGEAGCLVSIDGNKTVDAQTRFPDTTNQLFRFAFTNKLVVLSTDYMNSEYSTCAIGDGAVNTTTTATSTPCRGSQDEDDNFTLTYANTSGSTIRLAYLVIRCNGDFNNPKLCRPSTYTNPQQDLKNFFAEEALADLPAGKKRTCILKLADYPVDNETDEQVRRAISCTTTDIAPAVPNATSTPVPSDDDDDEDEDTYYAMLSLYNNSSHKIVHVKTRSCANGTTCVDDEGDVEIDPGTRELITFKLGNITPQTRFFTVRVYVTLEGEDEERGLNNALNVDEPQSVYYDLKVSNTKVEGTAETELEASDVSGNQCVNADDATRVISKLAEFTSPDQCLPEDINCDGVVNTLDLSVIISNLNGGSGCYANKPLK